MRETVFVLHEPIPYEGDNVISIHATRAGAEAARAEVIKLRYGHGDELRIDEEPLEP
jgi:hypothetical protein